MIDLILIPVAVIYLLVVLLLLIHGINLFYLTFISWKNKQVAHEYKRIHKYPKVTVQLPIYNELYVAERVIRETVRLQYPKDLLEIQILDDSTDETSEIIRNTICDLDAPGKVIRHLHRSNRRGFKAGALNEGLKSARGDFIAIFDADFVPPSDFLIKTLPYFTDSQVGFVQARWGHINPDYSFLTFIQSIAIDAHFGVEQFARWSAGYWFNFNGTAGIWRRKTITDAGGWSHQTLSEDLDLSYRAYLIGWKGVYLRDLVVPAELPVNISAFRRQQHRWARGSLECAHKHIPAVWSSSLPFSVKFQSTIHLLGYGIHILLCMLVLLHPLILLISFKYAGMLSLFGVGLFFNLATFSQAAFVLSAQRHLNKKWWRLLPMLFFIAAAGTGMMVNTAFAALDILLNKQRIFERTPKYGIVTRGQRWFTKQYQLYFDRRIVFELLFAMINGYSLKLSLDTQNWIIAFYSFLFLFGLLIISFTSIYQSAISMRLNLVHPHS